MYDFSGGFSLGDWGVSIGGGAGGYGNPSGGYSAVPQYGAYVGSYNQQQAQNQQMLFLGIIVLAAVLLLRK